MLKASPLRDLHRRFEPGRAIKGRNLAQVFREPAGLEWAAAADAQQRWLRSIGLAVAVGIAYFLAARLSLFLLTKPDGVAVFWPASGIATGVLIALGSRARIPVAAGTIAATIIANILGDRTLSSAVVFASCNAGEALIAGWLIEHHFGSNFSLDKLSHVLGLLAAAVVATAISGVGGTAGFLYFHSSTAAAFTIWQHWFASDALGIVTVAPLIIEFTSAARTPPTPQERTEGFVALAILAVLASFVVYLPQGLWGTAVPIALLFPMLLWLAARCRPVFTAAAAFIIALAIVWTTTFGIGIFGDASFPMTERVLAAQASILAISLCAFVLAALFAERRQHETVLVESGAQLQKALTELRLLYENAPIGLAFLSPDCRYQQINRHLTEICGISIADHIGQSVRDTVPQVAEQVEYLVQTILRTGEPITGVPVNGQRPDGSNARRIWNTYWHPLKAADGSILGVNVAAEEVTEQKEAEAALRIVNDTLEARTVELTKSLEELRNAQDRLVQTEKLASLGQLTAGIAHEIKNPLNFVTNFSIVSMELIDELQEAVKHREMDDQKVAEIGDLATTLRSNLDKIVRHGKRADSIVKNMLLHSREDSGERRSIDINTIVEESLNLVYHGVRAEKPGFNIMLQRSFDQAAGEAELFPQEITRVLLNVISNGFYAANRRKAQASGGDDYEPSLAVATRNLGDSVEITIRDNGTGISPDMTKKLFIPFFTTKPPGEGTGLGLSISHDIIVKQHAGSIDVDSRLGEFTEFKIVLPRTAPHEKAGG
jgi:PAS domain S-box-containing protein